jgi:hypothetical protein
LFEGSVSRIFHFVNMLSVLVHPIYPVDVIFTHVSKCLSLLIISVQKSDSMKINVDIYFKDTILSMFVLTCSLSCTLS